MPVRTQRFIPGAIARLKPGLSVAQAQARLDALASHLEAEHPTDYPAQARWRLRLVPLQQDMVGDTSLMLVLLLFHCLPHNRLLRLLKLRARHLYSTDQTLKLSLSRVSLLQSVYCVAAMRTKENQMSLVVDVEMATALSVV